MMEEKEVLADEEVTDSGTVVYVGIDQWYAGCFILSDEIREDAYDLVSTAAISSAAGELALAEVKDSKDADAVKEIFQARIDYQTGDGETPGGAFYPETTRQWEENSRIAAKGNYIMLVVAGDPDSIESDFNSLFA